MNNLKTYTLWLLIITISLVSPDYINTEILKDADYYCKKGIKLYKKGKLSEASVEWEKALSKDSQHKLANYYLEKATKQMSTINYYNTEAIRHFKNKDYIKTLENINAVLENDINDFIATIYIYKINIKLKKDKKLRQKIINNYKESDQRPEEITDNKSVKKAAAFYKTISLLDTDDKVIKKNKEKYEKQLSDILKKESINVYEQVGNEYFNENKYEKSIMNWRKAMQMDSSKSYLENKIATAFKLKLKQEKQKYLSALLEKGETALNSGLIKTANSFFNKVLQLDPDNEKALSCKDQLLEQGKNMEGRKNIQSQIQVNITAGKKLFNKGKFEKAQIFFNNALTLDKENKTAKNFLLKCHKKNKTKKKQEIEKIQKLLSDGINNYNFGNFEKAIAKLSECLILSPENKFAIKYLQLSKSKLHTDEDTITVKSPYYNVTYNLMKRGEHFLQIKKYNEAMIIFKSILELYPFNKIARKYIIKCSKHQKSKSLTSFLEKHIDSGRVYLGKGMNNPALKEFEMVKKISPDYPEINKLISKAKKKEKKSASDKNIKKYYKHGNDFFIKKDYQKAIENWEKVLELDPDNLKTILNLNKSYHLLMYNQIKSKRKSNKEKERQINNYYFNGLKYYNTGELENAIEMWQMVLEIDPDHIGSKNNIKISKLKIKDD